MNKEIFNQNQSQCPQCLFNFDCDIKEEVKVPCPDFMAGKVDGEVRRAFLEDINRGSRKGGGNKEKAGHKKKTKFHRAEYYMDSGD